MPVSDIARRAAGRTMAAVILMAVSLAVADAVPAEAKPLFPAYLIVLTPAGPIELSQPDLAVWLADATPIEAGELPAEVRGALPAVAFWGLPGDLTREQRMTFATSDAGRSNAGWWAPSASGGTLLLRSRVGTVNGSAALVQEMGFRSSHPLPGLPPPTSDQDGIAIERQGTWIAVAVTLVLVLIAGVLAARLRRGRTLGA